MLFWENSKLSKFKYQFFLKIKEGEMDKAISVNYSIILNIGNKKL